MAANLPESEDKPLSAEEKSFLDKRTWGTFKAVLFAGLSTACFFGVLQELVRSTIKSFAPTAANVVTAAAETTAFNLTSGAIMAGFMAVGAVFAYMGQRAWSETKVIEDRHTALKNAECLRGHAPNIVQDVTRGLTHEHPDHCRSDGKTWVQATKHQHTAPHLSV